VAFKRTVAFGEVNQRIIAQYASPSPLAGKERCPLLLRFDRPSNAGDIQAPGALAGGGDVIELLANGHFVHIFGHVVYS